MSETIDSVKRIRTELAEWAERNRAAGRLDGAEKIQSLHDDLTEVQDELVRLTGLTSALPHDLGNIHDLPSELLDELTVSKTDELEDQIVTVLNAYDGEASLDQILVGLYRKFGVVQKRRFVQNKLYRIDTVWGVAGKKGVYTTKRPLAETLATMNEVFSGGRKQLSSDEDEDDLPF